MSSQSPYLFVVGCPRSGTTLLQRMLDHHPQLAIANDTHFIPRAIGSSTASKNPPLDQELIERVRRYHRFPRLNLSDGVVNEAAASASTYSEFVSNLYSSFARLHEKPLAGEKTPDYVRYLPLLYDLFPEARVIHIIRDGRDVALSTLEWARPDKGPGRFPMWQEDSIAVCALWWRWQVSTGRQDGKSIGPDLYREVRYEDLVHQPAKVLQDMSKFLRLSFAPQMLAFYEGKTRHEPRLSAKKAWLPPTPGLREWRSQMAARDVELFEALAGDLLSELGYERSVPIISPAITTLAEERRRQWEEEMTRRRLGKARRSRSLDQQQSGVL